MRRARAAVVVALSSRSPRGRSRSRQPGAADRSSLSLDPDSTDPSVEPSVPLDGAVGRPVAASVRAAAICSGETPAALEVGPAEVRVCGQETPTPPTATVGGSTLPGWPMVLPALLYYLHTPGPPPARTPAGYSS